MVSCFSATYTLRLGMKVDEAFEAAEVAELRYVSDDLPCIRGRRRGRGWEYIGVDGRRITDERERRRINALTIPPAWTDVWICPDEDGHILATARDAKGRKQYRYHPRWLEARSETKFDKMADFGAMLPQLRRIGPSARSWRSFAEETERVAVPGPDVRAVTVRTRRGTLCEPRHSRNREGSTDVPRAMRNDRSLRTLVISAVVAVALVATLLAANGLGSSGQDGAQAFDPVDADVDLVEVSQIPSSPREDVPSALDDRFDESFPEPLVDPATIRSGGPPPDGIPSIDEPRFERVADVVWLEDREPVLVIEIDGDARAYPIQIMTWHEIVNDTFGDIPVTISYCPLCNSAIAYDRRVGDRVLDFGTSGSLLNSALVMYDRQTQSLWSHFTGEAIVGHLTGAELDLLPIQTISWADFREAHPDGLVLSRVTGFAREYGRNPYPGYDDVDNSPFLFEGEVDGRLAAQTRVVAVRGDTDSVAIVSDFLAEERVVSVDVDGRELVALLTPGTASGLDASAVAEGRDVGATGVFVPEANGQRLTFTANPDDETFTDAETGSTWTITGDAVSGPLAGTALEAVEHLDTFWFAIAAFEPDTEVVGG